MTRFLGVDTASDRKDRGYAIVDAGQLVWYGSAPPPREAGPIDFVAGERPWLADKLRGEAFISFAMNNGFQLRDAWPYEPWPVFVAMKVRDWKDLVLPGCAGYPGDVFCRNVQAKFAPHVTNHNVLDAIGIAVAASRLDPAQLKKLVQAGFKR